MPDLMQFKRGAFANLSQAKLKQGEPAYCYDTKTFVIGTGENNAPTLFINKEEITKLLDSVRSDYINQFNTTNSRIDNLEFYKINHENRIIAIENKLKEKIKSSQLSTAYDIDKIQLANLSQTVIAAINSGSGTGGGITEIPPGSIGFDLLAVEVNEKLSSDYGSY